MSDYRYMAVRVDQTDLWLEFGEKMFRTGTLKYFSRDCVEHVHGHFIYGEKPGMIGPTYYNVYNVGCDFSVSIEDLEKFITDFYKNFTPMLFPSTKIEVIPLGENRKIFISSEDIKVWADDYGSAKTMDEVKTAYLEDPFWPC